MVVYPYIGIYGTDVHPTSTIFDKRVVRFYQPKLIFDINIELVQESRLVSPKFRLTAQHYMIDSLVPVTWTWKRKRFNQIFSLIGRP